MTATGHRAKTASHLGAKAGLDDGELLAMYRMVALARAVDERMWILNRAGRIPFVISGQGHEGAQVGVTWALRKGFDWIAPYYRSIAMCMTFGMSARDIMLAQYARASDPSSGGRQMPGHYGDRHHNLLSVSSPVATQILHAVGIALAAKIRGTGQVALTAMGEGSSNQGDVHEALNFAAIHKLAVIFLVENNGFAISVPWQKQMPTEDVADRAKGYGIPGVIVDGCDAIACYRTAREAVKRARRGDGPTLIEAVTYRLEAHTTADDTSRYRSDDEAAEWRARDPVERFLRVLRDGGVVDDAFVAEVEAEGEATAARMRDSLFDAPAGDPREMFDHVYAARTPQLDAQRALLEQELRAGEEH